MTAAVQCGGTFEAITRRIKTRVYAQRPMESKFRAFPFPVG